MSSGYFGTVFVAAVLSLSYIETDCKGLSMLWMMDDLNLHSKVGFLRH